MFQNIVIQVPLNHGMVALVDERDADIVLAHKWVVRVAGMTCYAVRNAAPRIEMHRLILGSKKGVVVDHRDGNGLNNRRSNLRHATHQQNMQNKRRPSNNKSGYKGVHFHSLSGKWRAQITVRGRARSLGLFADPKVAAAAYDDAAIAAFGEFAAINLPERQKVEVSHLRFC